MNSSVSRLVHLGLAVMAVVAFGCTEDTGGQAPQRRTVGGLACDVPHIDFGVAKAGTAVDVAFSLLNTTKAPILIEKIRSDCNCTVPVGGQLLVPAGQRIEVPASIDLTNKSGAFSSRLSVDIAECDRSMVLSIGGIVEATGQIEIHPSSVNLGHVTPDQSIDAEIRVRRGDRSALGPIRFVGDPQGVLTASNPRFEGQAAFIPIRIDPTALAMGEFLLLGTVTTDHVEFPEAQVKVRGVVVDEVAQAIVDRIFPGKMLPGSATNHPLHRRPQRIPPIKSLQYDGDAGLTASLVLAEDGSASVRIRCDDDAAPGLRNGALTLKVGDEPSVVEVPVTVLIAHGEKRGNEANQPNGPLTERMRQ